MNQENAAGRKTEIRTSRNLQIRMESLIAEQVNAFTETLQFCLDVARGIPLSFDEGYRRVKEIDNAVNLSKMSNELAHSLVKLRTDALAVRSRKRNVAKQTPAEK